MHTVSNKVIVISGAASGMGAETSKYLSAQGATVSIADIQETGLKETASSIEKAGGKVLSTVIDVRDRNQVASWIEKTVDSFGKIDGCANLAGVAGHDHSQKRIEEVTDEDWDFVHGVNVKGVLNCMRAQIPHMKDGGSIVNAASIAGLVALPKTAAYVSSKFAVIGLTKTAAKELGERRIRCNCICPGAMDTPMLLHAANQVGATIDDFKSVAPLGRLGTVQDIANLVEWLLSDGSAFITGTSQRVDGGWVDY